MLQIAHINTALAPAKKLSAQQQRVRAWINRYNAKETDDFIAKNREAIERIKSKNPEFELKSIIK